MVQTAELKDGLMENILILYCWCTKMPWWWIYINSEWIPLQDLDTGLPTRRRISSHVPSDVTSISQPNVPQRLVFVSLTGAEDFQSVVPSSAFSSGIRCITLRGILRYLEIFRRSILQDYDSSLWVRRDGALIYGPDIAFDFDSEIADPESDSFWINETSREPVASDQCDFNLAVVSEELNVLLESLLLLFIPATKLSDHSDCCCYNAAANHGGRLESTHKGPMRWLGLTTEAHNQSQQGLHTAALPLQPPANQRIHSLHIVDLKKQDLWGAIPPSFCWFSGFPWCSGFF